LQQRSEETRAHILTAATQAFAREGYDATGVAEICAAAGVSKGAFYHHFPTKQAVFLTLLEEYLAEVDRSLEAALVDSSSVAQGFLQMVEQVGGVFRTAGQRLPMFLEFWTQASRDPSIRGVVLAPYQRYQDYFAALIRRGIADGSLRETDPDLAARALVSLAVGLFLQGILNPDGAAWDEVTQGSIRLFLDGLACERTRRDV